MKKEILIFFFLLLSQLISYSQNIKVANPNDTMKYSKSDIEKLNTRIIEFINSSAYPVETDSIHFYHIFNYGYFDKLKKQEFLNGNFLKLLINLYDEANGKLYPSTKCLLVDENKKFIGNVDSFRYLGPNPRLDKTYHFFLDKKEKLRIRYLFRIAGLVNFPTFGVTDDGSIYVFIFKDYQYVRVEMSEFIEIYKDYFAY